MSQLFDQLAGAKQALVGSKTNQSTDGIDEAAVKDIINGEVELNRSVMTIMAPITGTGDTAIQVANKVLSQDGTIGFKALGQQLPDMKMLTGGPSSLLSAGSAKMDGALNSLNGKLSGFSLSKNSLLGGNAGSSPDAANMTAKEIKTVMGIVDPSEHRVYLKSILRGGKEIVFDNMPTVTETRTVDYEPISPLHMPGEFHKYRGTKSATWSVEATLTSRTPEEAKFNCRILLLLRTWTMPFWGSKQASGGARGMLGAPPPILEFGGWRGLVGPVDTVMTSVNWSYPKDVEWISLGKSLSVDGASWEKSTPFPTVMSVSLSLVECLDAENFDGFDIAALEQGKNALVWIPTPRVITELTSATPIPQITGGRGDGSYSEKPGERREYMKAIRDLSTQDPEANEAQPK